MLALLVLGPSYTKSRKEWSGSSSMQAKAFQRAKLSTQRINSNFFHFLKWAMVEKFHDYLYGVEFTVVTDSNPLTYLVKSTKLDASSYRWLSALSAFNFKILYRSGRQCRPHGELVKDYKSQKEQERITRFTQQHLDPASVLHDEQAVRAIWKRHLL